jgi:hypothetical protein
VVAQATATTTSPVAQEWRSSTVEQRAARGEQPILTALFPRLVEDDMSDPQCVARTG